MPHCPTIAPYYLSVDPAAAQDNSVVFDTIGHPFGDEACHIKRDEQVLVEIDGVKVNRASHVNVACSSTGG